MSSVNNRNRDPEEFLASFQQGGEKGMTFIFNHYYKRLCLYAITILNDPQAAEDVVQDVFARIWANKIPLRNMVGISTYLYSMIRNDCYKHINERQARRNREIKSFSVPGNSEYDIVNQLIFTETLYIISSSMNALPPKCRQIFRMLYFQGKDYTQISQELNIAESTVRTQKARAIAIIKQRLHLLLLIAFLIEQYCR
jgi:RNA polymerase sigma-70 factor (family 1)